MMYKIYSCKVSPKFVTHLNMLTLTLRNLFSLLTQETSLTIKNTESMILDKGDVKRIMTSWSPAGDV